MSLNVRTSGAGDPLLLLHGFTGTAESWRHQETRWSRDHRVIAADLLGHGGSATPTDPQRYALERQSADLVELLQLLDAIPADVVGYSMGARLALVLALSHPDAMGRLVLESPSAGIEDPAARSARRAADEQLAGDIERHGLVAFVERWETLPRFASHAALPPEARARLRSERLSHDPRGLAASLRGAGQGAMPPLHGRLGEITAATLVIAGELDTRATESAGIVAQGIPGAVLEILPSAGHTPHLERPDEFTRIMTDFLVRAKPPSRTEVLS